jgi:hypothetical protein
VKEPESLEQGLAKQIAQPLGDVSLDHAELALDELFDNDLVKEIPLVKTVAAVYRGVVGIRERQFVRKLLSFLHEVQSQGTDGPKWEEFRVRLDHDDEFRRRCTEHILIIIDRFIEDDKAKIAGQLLLAHVEGKIDWERFVDLTLCLERLHRGGYDLLQNLVDPPEGVPNREGHGKDAEGFLASAGLAIRYGTDLNPTRIGVELYSLGVKPVIFPLDHGQT